MKLLATRGAISPAVVYPLKALLLFVCFFTILDTYLRLLYFGATPLKTLELLRGGGGDFVEAIGLIEFLEKVHIALFFDIIVFIIISSLCIRLFKRYSSGFVFLFGLTIFLKWSGLFVCKFSQFNTSLVYHVFLYLQSLIVVAAAIALIAVLFRIKHGKV